MYSFYWFRRDLRINDNIALYKALKSGLAVVPIFIFDENILSKLKNKSDKRVQLIWDSLNKLNSQLKEIGSELYIYYGNPERIWNEIFQSGKCKKLFFNLDYEPYAIERDKKVHLSAKKYSISIEAYKDHIIFSPTEILKKDRTDYRVYTPYSEKWREEFYKKKIQFAPSENHINDFHELRRNPFPELKKIKKLEQIGFNESGYQLKALNCSKRLLANYKTERDFPELNGTSNASVYLRFGLISIRELVVKAAKNNESWLKEFIWREFFIQHLYHHPRICKEAFKAQYDKVQYINDKNDYIKWCEGKTGYPIVDAGMRELNHTGYMHNRVRMITASFLIKHLLIDWRWGERYFAEKLLDFELASNVGNWQWAASSGCDSVPYFRIFNPHTQLKKFDKNHNYINKWIPELNSSKYPSEIIEHSFARNRVLEKYKSALK